MKPFYQDNQKILRFKIDTKPRKGWFTGVSFSHPAKMSLPLQLWLIENFTKAGEMILDPMAGSGTILVACSMGRNVIAVELEEKFVKMMEGNWAKIQERGPMMGYQMGKAQILQGDARRLEGLLVGKCIFSLPYVGITAWQDPSFQQKVSEKYGQRRWSSDGQGQDSEKNISNLPYGQVDKVITSPPYEESMGDKHHSPHADKLAKEKSNPTTYTDKVDAILTSSLYENQIHKGSGEWSQSGEGKLIGGELSAGGKLLGVPQCSEYIKSSDNIGNLKSTSYLEAMAQVYAQCYAVLKPQGLLILVTKNFIRNQKEIRLDSDTIKLCEQAGFIFQERWYRELPAQSFWRTIYKRRFPNAPELKFEDILIFRKGIGS